MRRALSIGAAALVAGLALSGPARAESVLVSMTTTDFSPSKLDVLIGDNVVWRNNSIKTHNVKFDVEGFDSGRIAPREAASHPFDTAGAFEYVCTIHDGMNGEVAVHPLLLGGPRGTVRRGTPVALHVRAPEDAGEVAIEADSGSGFQRVAVAGAPEGGGHEGHMKPGTLHATVVASESATYRAVSADGSSPGFRVEVTDGSALAVGVKRRGRAALVSVKASPAAPGARVVLQLRLRERFGWWPLARARLDGRSRARFAVRGHGRAPARVALVGADWSTPVAQSRVLRLPGRR
jgi:plastocyanin